VVSKNTSLSIRYLVVNPGTSLFLCS
jgi:hypothetical protein